MSCLDSLLSANDNRHHRATPSPLMPRRQFTDADGVQWAVQDVVAVPGFSRPGAPQLAPHSEVFRPARIGLIFESATEKRHLAGIPDDWEQAPEAELQRLLGLATKVSKHSP
jgi:hypothetical protein